MRLKTRKRILFSALCAASTLSAAAAAYSQATAQMWDSSQLPATNGTVRQYTLTPRGDVDGLILSDGTEVKVPPHLTGQIVYSTHPGDAVTIRGLRARALPLVQAESITNNANGRTVVDNGPPGPAGAGPETTLSGRVSATLHGARGEVNGALLDNGIILRLPPPEADRMQAFAPAWTDRRRPRRAARYRARQRHRRSRDRVLSRPAQRVTGRSTATSWRRPAARRTRRLPAPARAGFCSPAAASAPARLRFRRFHSASPQVTAMHWIDPGCLPETQGMVESFIPNRHGEIDGLLIAAMGQASLLVCTPPPPGRADRNRDQNWRCDPHSRCPSPPRGHYCGRRAYRKQR